MQMNNHPRRIIPSSPW